MAQKKVVAIGGGTGLSNLLRVLRELAVDLTAVVAMTDNGGSSGMLRREFGMLPPGDIRNCLSALSQKEAEIGRLLAYRFPEGGTLSGHNVGNILLAAIMQAENLDFVTATAKLAEILAVSGRVLPATADDVSLCAVLEDGSEICGEAEIAADSREIKRLYLVGEACRPLPAVIEAIAEADCIFIGPGSIYSSIISNLLLKGFAGALYNSKARVCYLANMATEPMELQSDRVSVAHNLLEKYFEQECGIKTKPSSLIDVVVANSGSYSDNAKERLLENNSRPIVCDMEDGAVRVITADFVDEVNLWQHNRQKLKQVLADFLEENI